jgi:TonB family protein
MIGRGLFLVAALAVYPEVGHAQSSVPGVDSMPLKLHLGAPGAAARPGSAGPVAHFDKAPELLSMPSPQVSINPNGVGGSVRLQFVVDSTGKVDPATVEVVSSSNQSFNGPAIDALLLSRWRPAELNHHPVRAPVVTTIPIKR